MAHSAVHSVHWNTDLLEFSTAEEQFDPLSLASSRCLSESKDPYRTRPFSVRLGLSRRQVVHLLGLCPGGSARSVQMGVRQPSHRSLGGDCRRPVDDGRLVSRRATPSEPWVATSRAMGGAPSDLLLFIRPAHLPSRQDSGRLLHESSLFILFSFTLHSIPAASNEGTGGHLDHDVLSCMSDADIAVHRRAAVLDPDARCHGSRLALLA